MRIVCIDGESQYYDIVKRDVIEPLAVSGHQLDWFEERFADADATIARAQGYDGVYIIGDQGPLPERFLSEVPGLKQVSFVGTGAHRFVNVAEAERLGITVTNVPDFASRSVAEHAIALMFALARRVPEGDRIVRAGDWQKNQGIKLRGRVLGVVGTGAIGREVIDMGHALGMEVVFWNRTERPEAEAKLPARRVTLEELFRVSDVVSLHLTHTPETEGLISAELLSSLPSNAIVINTARDEILDRDALLALLREERIFGAGLDVFESEPPQLDQLPVEHPNLILTPHIGFHTDEADEVFAIAGQNIVAFAEGAPRNVVRSTTL
ncbi:D-3-phosphoglycerate dehydrogenase [Pseudoclavibacter sp. JAI123]|uniref:2-hydroxyacid dehydrogenase n=1 Tax=Pseudoclavibacter sp. JAI123 TaxID=2723065 RepID=UPI0015CBE0A5|nr:2-hydroxyacid dehydrogenase [Pseudoclavibacter sp. JAI123]NYF14264.1 D-3-phosphoglycerate dehydrogenase [Pseudoclavibacter sp. JAI123]